MYEEISTVIKKWLDGFGSHHTTKNYDIMLKRMIRLEMVPDLTLLSLEEINEIDHKKIIDSLKTNRTITPNSRILYAGMYSSLIRFIQAYQGIICCAHVCKKDNALV